MVTRVCMNLTIVLQLVDCVETDTYIFMRFGYYRLGFLIFSSGRYGSTGRDPFSSEYHLTLETSLSEKFKFPCENIN